MRHQKDLENSRKNFQCNYNYTIMAKRKTVDTSLAAFHSLDEAQISEIKRQILSALSQIKEGTFEDISACLKLSKDKIWKRLSEMCIDGLIYRPGNKKALSSGRMGYTWKIVPAESGGIIPEKVTEKALPGKSVSDYSKKITQLTCL